MRALLLAATLLAGCATHTHIGDCASCAGFVLVQDQVNDAAQTKAIYSAVGKALEAERRASAVAPIRSTT